MTLLLTRSDILALLDPPTILDALRTGFTQPTDLEPLRVRTDLPGPGTATIPGIPAYTVKVNAKFPDASPALRGVVCLHDLTDGALLALMDSATITAWRTGLAAALATDVLAPSGASTVGVIGARAQAELTIRGLTALRTVESLVVNDVHRQGAAGFLAGQGIPGVAASNAAGGGEAGRHRSTCDLVPGAAVDRSRCPTRASSHHPGCG